MAEGLNHFSGRGWRRINPETGEEVVDPQEINQNHTAPSEEDYLLVAEDELVEPEDDTSFNDRIDELQELHDKEIRETAEKASALFDQLKDIHFDLIAKKYYQYEDLSEEDVQKVVSLLDQLLPLLPTLANPSPDIEHYSIFDNKNLLMDIFQYLDYPEIHNSIMNHLNEFYPSYNDFTGWCSFFKEYEYQIILRYGKVESKDRVAQELHESKFDYFSSAVGLYTKAFPALLEYAKNNPEFIQELFSNLDERMVDHLCYNCMLCGDQLPINEVILAFEKYSGLTLSKERWAMLIQTWGEGTEQYINRDSKVTSLREGISTGAVNLQMISELAEEVPGIVEVLMDRYGIRFFGRYPKEMLIDSVMAKEGDNRPVWLNVLPYRDHNDAFYESRAIQGLYNQTADEYRPQIYECGGKYGLIKALKHNFDQNGPGEFMILGGHGRPDSIQLGDDTSNIGKLTIDDFSGKGGPRAAAYLKDTATVILESCSTGAAGGIAEEIFQKTGLRVIGPEEPTHMISVTKYKGDKEEPRFAVRFRSNEVNQNLTKIYEKK